MYQDMHFLVDKHFFYHNKVYCMTISLKNYFNIHDEESGSMITKAGLYTTDTENSYRDLKLNSQIYQAVLYTANIN